MSIHDLKEKIKDLAGSEKGKDFFVVGIIILASTFSFGLGRLSMAEKRDSVRVEYDPSLLTASAVTGVKDSSNSSVFGAGDSEAGSNAPSGVLKSQGSYFASKRGKKYYPVDCSAGQSILESNKIYFSTSADAEKAGYSLSSSCK